MHTKWIMAPGRGARARNAARTLGYAVAMALTPVIAHAQHDEDKPVPLDPQTAAAQNRTLGIITLMVVLAIAWYYFRRWQIIRAASHDDRKE